MQSRPQTAIMSVSQSVVWPMPLIGTQLLVHREDEVNTHRGNPQQQYNGRSSHRYHMNLPRQALDRATEGKSRTGVYYVWVRDLQPGGRERS